MYMQMIFNTFYPTICTDGNLLTALVSRQLTYKYDAQQTLYTDAQWLHHFYTCTETTFICMRMYTHDNRPTIHALQHYRRSTVPGPFTQFDRVYPHRTTGGIVWRVTPYFGVSPATSDTSCSSDWQVGVFTTFEKGLAQQGRAPPEYLRVVLQGKSQPL